MTILARLMRKNAKLTYTECNVHYVVADLSKKKIDIVEQSLLTKKN